MDGGSESPPAITAQSGFVDDGDGPTQVKRNRKAGGNNLRKSLAWNPAFFTEEGVLNPTELSLLGGQIKESTPDAPSGISKSPLMPYNKCNRLSTHGEKPETAKDSKAGESYSKRESLNHEQPQSHMIPLSRNIPRSVPPSLATHSQKRPSSGAASDPVTKIPKLMSLRSQGSTVPINSRDTLTKMNYEFGRSNYNVESSSGSSSFTPYSAKSLAQDHEKHTVPMVEKGSASLKVMADPSFSTKPRESSTFSSSGRIAPAFPRCTNGDSGAPSAAACAKPSALRLPSPSMGFFSQRKVSPSYSSQSQRPIQPSDSSTMKKATGMKNAGQLRTLISTAQHSTRGTAPTSSSVGTTVTSSTKNLSVESVEMKQRNTRDRRDSITLGVCHHPINAHEQLSTSVGDNFRRQPSEVLLEKPDHDQAKVAPYEDNSVSQKIDEILHEKTGSIQQFLEIKIPKNTNIAEPSNGDSKGSGKPCANFLSKQGINKKQLQENNVAGEHQLVGNTGYEACTFLSEDRLAAQSLYSIPDIKSELIAKDNISSASPEAESTCSLSNTQMAGEASCTNFSSQRGSDCQQLQEDDIEPNKLTKHPLVGSTNGVYITLGESELAAQNSHCLDDSGSGPIKSIESGVSTEVKSGVSTEVRPSLISNIEEVEGEVSCTSFSSKPRTEYNQQQESNFRGENPAQLPHVGNTTDETCRVQIEGKLAVQSAYQPPECKSGLNADTIDSSASVETGSPNKLRKEEIVAGGTHNYIRPDSSLLQDSLSEGFKCTTSEDVVLDVNRNSEIRSLEGESELKPDIVQMKSKVNAPPFSDEWLAALETFGEEILQLKSGPVQNSPPDKYLPEPGPWSPVKRKAEDIGPFDCTKYTKNAPSSNIP